jgi:hypothetical protein
LIGVLISAILIGLIGVLISASASAQYYQPPAQYQPAPAPYRPGYHYYEQMRPVYGPKPVTSADVTAAWAAARNGYPPPPQPIVQLHPGFGWYVKDPPTVVIVETRK